MRTRSGFYYLAFETEDICTSQEKKRTEKRGRDAFSGDQRIGQKRRVFFPIVCGGGTTGLFEPLPEDLVLSILCKLSSSASSPADFINFLVTCKKFYTLGLNSLVLSKASQKMLAIKADNWSEYANGFLKLCADSGNVEAMYTLGMIRFYCLQQRSSGVSMMGKAACESHAQALYSLAIIQFNGSGGSKKNINLNAGVTLCAKAASLGHINAHRTLGHCYRFGYGVKKNVTEGHRLLLRATALEVMKKNVMEGRLLSLKATALVVAAAISDFSWANITAPKSDSVDGFLREWFAGKGSDLNSDLRLCANSDCGRIETRRREFRGCSDCGVVSYCCRACQMIDWKVKHKTECTLGVVVMEENIRENEANGEVVGGGNGDVAVAVIPEVEEEVHGDGNGGDDVAVPEVDGDENGDA